MRNKISTSRAILFFFIVCSMNSLRAQTMEEKYNEFKNKVKSEYSSFRKACNDKYVEFLLSAWDWYNGSAPIPAEEKNPIPPMPYEEENQEIPITITPIEIEPVVPSPQPKPIEPIKENPVLEEEYFTIDFYSVKCNVRLPESAKVHISDCSPKSISNGWQLLSEDNMDNAIRDCLETRIRYKLCDWAYLLFLDELSKQFCSDSNSATLLMAFLFCQSGYQMRLANDGNKLLMLYGSKHLIYNCEYYNIEGTYFYPYGDSSRSIQICNAKYEGETPLSLAISSEQLFGEELSDVREIKSRRQPGIVVNSQVSENLIKFFNTYPSSAVNGNMMTRWAMYANTSLSSKTKELIYPALEESIKGLSEEKAANQLLNWVQTGFVYEYDDKVWGHDRAFFAEETLYYPYCDCEDRSILYSRLIRDLLGLDVALVYYPGHLATAVCFNEEIPGDAMVIDGRRFLVCDPTYIGAPIGVQMPRLDYEQTQAIILDLK